MGAWTRLALVGIVAAATAGVATALALPSAATAEQEVDGPPAVRVASVTAAPTHRTARLLGITRAADRGVASFTVGGRVVARPVEVGDAVMAGDVLARLDPVPLAHRVAQARARVDDLTATADQLAADRARLTRLRAGDAISEAELERLVSREASVRAGLDQARVGLDEAVRLQREGVLRAPYAAVVTAVHAEAGETVGAGQPVVELAGAGLEVPLEAPATVWAGLEAGRTARVELPDVGCTVDGTVHRVGTPSGTPGRLFPVQIALPEAGSCRLAPGLTARVDVDLPVAEALAVPVRAVSDPTGSGAVVYRLAGDRVEAVPVTPVRLAGDAVAVQGALATADEVVVSGLVGLADGQLVEVSR